MSTTTDFLADASSAQNDGAVVTAGGVTISIGGVTPPDHAHLRFNASTLADTDTVVNALLKLKTVTATAVINVDAWASEFGAAIATGDYNLNSGAGSNSSPVRVALKQIIAAGTLINVQSQINVPSRFVNKVAATNSGFSDFEIRQGTGWTSGAPNITSIHGPGAASSGDKPTLTVVSVTAAEMAAGSDSTYRFLAIGSESYLAFDIETTPGQAVKGKVLLDVTSSSLDSYVENIASSALSKNRVRPRKITVGRAGAGGDFSFELTPEKCWKLLLGMFKVTTTGPVSSIYTHTFTVATSAEIKTMTFVQKIGAFRFVYPGSMIGSLSIRAALDAPVTASAACMARQEWMYDENSGGGSTDDYLLTSDAGYDTVDNSILSFVGASITFDGNTDPGLVQNFTLSIDQGVNERRGLSGSRFVAGHYPTSVVSTLAMTLYFENEAQYKKFIGDSTQDFPTRAQECLQFQQVVITLNGVCNNTGFVCTITIPKMLYTTIRKPVGDQGAVMLDCSGTAVLSGTDYVSFAIQNTESGYSASTDNITVVPSGVTYPS